MLPIIRRLWQCISITSCKRRRNSGESTVRSAQQRLNIAIICVDVDVDLHSGRSLEDAARVARYDAFETIVRHDDVLFFGHHLDDQVETMLLRLLRGSGSRGAAAMPSSRALGSGQLARPLLDIPRSAIETYATINQLEWIDDSSNQSMDFDRNFLRLEVFACF